MLKRGGVVKIIGTYCYTGKYVMGSANRINPKQNMPNTSYFLIRSSGTY